MPSLNPTLATVREAARLFGFTVRRVDGEYRVARNPHEIARRDGVPYSVALTLAEAGAYYTDDAQDAVDTMAAIAAAAHAAHAAGALEACRARLIRDCHDTSDILPAGSNS